jgi:hypothetical protein
MLAILRSTPKLLVASAPAEVARRIWATQLTASLLRTLEVRGLDSADSRVSSTDVGLMRSEDVEALSLHPHFALSRR